MSHSINGHFTPASLLKFAAPSIIMMMFMSLYTIIDGIFYFTFCRQQCPVLYKHCLSNH